MEPLPDNFREKFDTIGHEVIRYSESGQPVDIIFHRKKPLISVIISPLLSNSLEEGMIVEDIWKLFRKIPLANGLKVDLMDIWMLNPMPFREIAESEMAAQDLREGENVLGQSGETIREMVKHTYHCENPEEEEYFLRRLLASWGED